MPAVAPPCSSGTLAARLIVAMLAVGMSLAPARATSLYDFFVNYRRQDVDLQIAFSTEVLRSARLQNGKLAGCIEKNFVKHGPAFLPVYDAFKIKLYSTITPAKTGVEQSIVEAISETCNPAAQAAYPDLARDNVSVHPTDAFHSEYQDDAARLGAATIAVNTQLARVTSEGDDAYAGCLSEKLVTTDGAIPADLKALLDALGDDKTAWALGAEGQILGAIIYFCKEEPVKDVQPETPAQKPAGQSLTDLDRKNAKAFEDFQAGLKATGKVLDQMQAEHEKKLAEATEQVAAMEKMAYRVPDGRRVYPASDGSSWMFEDSSYVPAYLFEQAIPPPKDGWPSRDMRLLPKPDLKAEQAVIDQAPKDVLEAMRTNVPEGSDAVRTVFDRMQVYVWEQSH